jgi:hypothetical protein
LREINKVRPFLDDINGYVFLLRRHSFLRYIADVREYNVKRMVVIDGIAEALRQITNVSLMVIYDEVPVESLSVVSIETIQRLMRQTIRNMKRSLYSLDCSSSIAKGYSQAILLWERALQAFRVCTLRSARTAID